MFNRALRLPASILRGTCFGKGLIDPVYFLDSDEEDSSDDECTLRFPSAQIVYKLPESGAATANVDSLVGPDEKEDIRKKRLQKIYDEEFEAGAPRSVVNPSRPALPLDHLRIIAREAMRKGGSDEGTASRIAMSPLCEDDTAALLTETRDLE